MINKVPTVAIYLDVRRKVSDGKHPVTIRVTYDRKAKYYTTPYSLTPDEYAKLWTPKARKQYKDILSDLKALEKKALEVIRQLNGAFTFKAFELKFLSKKSQWNNIITALNGYATKLRGEGSISTAVNYELTAKSISGFAETEKLQYRDITPEFLRKYQQWMISQERSITTVSMYTRNIRTVFNNAIRDRLISKEIYPFGLRKNGLYEIPAARNIKKALSLTEIKKIFDYIPEDEAEARARDMWIFIYLGNGLNVKDLGRLRYKDIHGDFIRFTRAKTVRTKKEVSIIEVPITDRMPEIIQRWGNTCHPDNFIFPILEPDITPAREREMVQNATHTINKFTKRIGKALDIAIPLTTYVARHSYASVLKRSGVSAEYISEALGHSNLKTTQAYLASFEDDKKLETAKALTAFKNVKQKPQIKIAALNN